jgi:hypothetical protein
MKIVMAMVFGVIASAHVMAASPSDSWDAIRADRSVSTIEQGSYAAAFGADGYFNACVKGAVLKSLRPLTICAEGKYVHSGGGQESGSDDYVCTRYATQDVTLALIQNEQRCVQSVRSGGQESGGEDVCVKWQPYTVSIPTTQTFSVYTKQTGR